MYDDAYTRNDDGELAVRTVSVTEGSNSSSYDDVFTRDTNGKLALRVTGGGSGDSHNKGYFADLEALQEAYPTGEAGDWAILGSTDTVWIWDTDNSEWVDSDKKGQVTSVNNKTGAVVLDAQDVGAVPQYSTMPTASVDNLGDIVQFIGTTDATYTNGYFYKCVSDGQDPATYAWEAVEVQASSGGLPSQTGNAGKFLTTDGTDASWSNKPLVNTATSSYSLAVGAEGIQTTGGYSTSFGTGSYAKSNYSVSIGAGTVGTSSNWGMAIGSASVGNNAPSAIAIHGSAKAERAIQIGRGGTNSDANTLKVANANGNFEIMSADGTVPTARLTKVNTTATLAVADWSSSTQTVTVSGVKADSVVFVSPAPASASDYASAGILCTSQSADSLTFSCTQTPSAAIVVNIVCM